MGKRTGNPRGRPPGSKSKWTVEFEAQVKANAAKIESAIPEAFAGDAHAYLMTVYKDPSLDRELRIDAAKAAIRYEKPALATIDVTSTNEHVVHTISRDPIAPEERDRQWAERHATAH